MSAVPVTEAEWEALFAPYDETTYAAALAALEPGDTVLDIGAGDFRFARRAAARVRRVIGLEQHAELLPRSVPENVTVVCGDARTAVFPKEITAAVLLMRHCRHFALYVDRLRQVGCRRLITNARWGMGVEVVELFAPRIAYDRLPGGWYACECGRVGYKPQKTTTGETVVELCNCPGCV